MNWKRLNPGCYIAGPYKVVKRKFHTGWCAHGPGGETVGVPLEHATMAAAKRVCEEAAAYNAGRHPTTCTCASVDGWHRVGCAVLIHQGAALGS